MLIFFLICWLLPTRILKTMTNLFFSPPSLHFLSCSFIIGSNQRTAPREESPDYTIHIQFVPNKMFPLTVSLCTCISYALSHTFTITGAFEYIWTSEYSVKPFFCNHYILHLWSATDFVAIKLYNFAPELEIDLR